ncbi:hypothetical protein PGT21_006022 [Puccinia graminis f. sp. tritici]|uniref:Secreted protein n=1 Tax=Puccinia graminis f. sp. tritici TaxID=56615 RepID=A0A5B0Q4Y3_PUCGR|nr:hypothetical protein PGT21_006022 [Puccinia graminis f. sp. tritici]
MVHQAIAILMMFSILIICCLGQPIASPALTRRDEPTTDNVLTKRRVKTQSLNDNIQTEDVSTNEVGPNKVVKTMAKPAPF